MSKTYKDSAKPSDSYRAKHNGKEYRHRKHEMQTAEADNQLKEFDNNNDTSVSEAEGTCVAAVDSGITSKKV